MVNLCTAVAIPPKPAQKNDFIWRTTLPKTKPSATKSHDIHFHNARR